MPKQTRQRIIDFLSKHTSSSAEEIGRALSMTKENIQYHLKHLSNDGLVEIDRSKKNIEIIRGRPILYYKLAEPVYPSDINHLADCLLRLSLLYNSTGNDKQLIMSELARIMFKYAESPNLTQTLQLAVKNLNEHQYQASWEARLKGPRIIFHNCPYTLLLKDHPELCTLDRFILETLTGSSIQQVARRQSGQESQFTLRPEDA